MSTSTTAVRPRRTQAERRAESERRLLDAAAALVVERGIEGTSLAEIGRVAGYSHGLVHHRFGSKEALVERLNTEAVRLFTSRTVTAVGSTRGLAALRIVADTYLDLVQAPDPLGRVHLVVWTEAVSRASERRSSRVTWDRYFRSAFAQLIRDAAADGSVRDDVDPDAMATVVVGLLRGVALQLMMDPETATTRTRSAVLDHLTRMLAA
ncbi:TetR/AcrR family transcriptional regulator [Marmoricola sp. RAF53]|uniref:TetR/AcrR family transcriptional regulator n=1 Tax=Marmoricola sp. RAF53 TaxID=3233059 RepID=UPI003F967351